MNINYIKKNLKNLADYKQIKNISNHFEKDELLYIIKHSDELINQTFTFDKPLDMERCVKPYTLNNIEWNTICNDDEEWCFMLNRMDYLNDLCISYLATNDTKYLDKAKFFIFDWIEKHKTIKLELSTRTLDTAMRLFSWLQTFIVLESENQLTNDEITTIYNSVLAQLEYLHDNYLDRYKISNWGSIQTAVIVSIVPVFIEYYHNNYIYKWAYKELKLQFEIQVYDDGMFWEQSTMYHLEVLNYGMKAIYYYRYFNDEKDEKWIDNVKKLANALFYQLTPNFEIETFGDTDRICAKEIFHRASVLFENSLYKYVGDSKYDIDSIYMFGCNFANRYKQMEATKPIKLTYDGNDAGMYVIRSSWDRNSSFTMFTNGSLGSGHGHSDNLHLSICYKGEFMLIDSGRFTYREDHPMRLELKSEYAHNRAVLNNNPCCVPKGSWEYTNFCTPLKNYVNHKENYHYLEGVIIGNNPLQVYLRKVVVINPNIWLIVDQIKVDNENTAKLYYHIDPDKQASIKDNIVYIKGDNANLKIVQENEPNLDTKPCSLRYNELLDHTVVTYEKTFNDEINFITCICDENIEVEDVDLYQANKKTPTRVAQAKKFKISDTESYTIAIYNKEIYEGSKILFCEGIAFHSKCIIIYEKDGEKTYQIMKS